MLPEPSGSPAGSGTWIGLSAVFSPWLNQSWVMNWIQAAAMKFRLGAGLNSPRASRVLLTSRGLGLSRVSVSAHWCSGFTLRPKRMYTEPSAGLERMLQVPSSVRATWLRGSQVMSGLWRAEVSVSDSVFSDSGCRALADAVRVGERPGVARLVGGGPLSPEGLRC